ncbi:hypothetical protein QBC37DRAFT_458885 [Rhypophila decipiens]|uniref:DUF6604 domain-containing protein n=1 Tax=Rhypophila decipiens TaxID=261697 RepID=A0AAN6XXR6_9PEZI|nr:hypothetical protein QBC37DRAFT_458885 [Rhypophila decipiens]
MATDPVPMPTRPKHRTIPRPRLRESSEKRVSWQRQQAQQLAGPSAAPAAATSTAKSTHGNQKQYVLAIKDFCPMADYIAKREPALKVPDFFAVAIERVIWVRKTFAEKLAETGAKLSGAADSRHNYFVGILESVRNTLKPLMEAGVYNMDELKKATAAATEGATKDKFRNMFSVLGVYEPSEAFLNAPDVAVPKTSDQPQYVAERVDDGSEALFVYAGFLRDLSRIRDEVLSLWDQWAKGELDLTAAAVATNTAFELARTMEDEIRPVLDKKGGGAKVASRYYEVLCNRAGIRINVMSRSHWDESYEIGMETLSAARAQKEILKVPPVYNGKFGWYDESQAGRASSNAEKLARDKAIFSELFADLHFAARDPHRQIFLPDQLIRGMDQVVNSVGTDDDFDMNCTPLWFAWAVRTYLDIVVKLGKDCSKGFFQMQDEIYHMKRSVSGISNPDVLPGYKRFAQELVNWDQDFMRERRVQGIVVGMHTRSCMPPDPPYRFLRHNPIYCGLWLLQLRLEFHYLDVSYAAPPAGIMHVTQLYHALRQEKLLPEPLKWHDLETFRQMQGDSAFFVGEPPTTMDDHYKNYTLCIGNSITNWAKNKRLGKGGRPASNKPTQQRPALGRGDQAILEKGRDLAARNGKGFLRSDKKEDNAQKSAMVPFGPTTPVNVLRQLALDIDADVSNLKFDYITMHNTCWDLLLRLKTKFSEVMGTDMSNHLPPTEVHLTFLLGYVFLFASGHSAELTVKLPPGSESNILLYAAAEVFSKFLKEGNNATRILDAQKKGLSDTEKKALDDAFHKYRVEDTFPGYEEGMRQMGRRPNGPDSDDEGGDDFGNGRDLEQELMEVARGNPEAAQLMNMLQQMMGGQRRGGQGRRR